jgi:hypothetical protein
VSLSVSSWFLDQMRAQHSSPRRYFLFGGSDYSDRVLRWPAVQYRADTINLGTINLSLGNIGRPFQFLVDSPRSLTTSCEIALSFSHPTSGEERISLYLGQPAHVEFGEDGTQVRLQLQGKTRTLTDAVLGSAVQSGGLDFATSGYYPADLAWYLVTSYGGLSALANLGNPDLDYAQWSAWRELNVIRDDRVKAYLAGEKIYSVLNDLAAMSSITISFQDAKLRFQPVFDAASADLQGFAPREIGTVRLALDPSRLLNRVDVDADYSPASGRFLASVSKVHSDSQSRFGLRSTRYGRSSVWFSTAADGRYLAEDLIRFNHDPSPRLSVTTPLAGGVNRVVGDVLMFTDSYLGVSSQAFRVTEMRLDLDQGQIEFELEQARRRPWQFETAVASYNLLVRTIQAVGSDTFLALDEAGIGRQVLRTGGDGRFQPVSTIANALLSLNAGEVLFGGAPSSSSTQAVLRRSSNSGSSSTVVYSLGPNIARVYDIFEVKSGTYLASTTSGGVLRSTDAGSAWNLTQSISGDYFINRFHQPSSGRIWGGTGHHGSLAEGLFVWESTNQGQSWALRHTVVASGGGRFNAHGWFRLTDSEQLLGSEDTTFSSVRMFRSRWTSNNSIGWIVVNTGASFTHMLRTVSGHLLMGFDQETTLNGGVILRSLDQGSSWAEDARIAKQGNVRLIDRGGELMTAFLSRTPAGAWTYRYANTDPNELN